MHGPLQQSEHQRRHHRAPDIPARLRRLSVRGGVYSQPASPSDIHALHAMLGQHLEEPLAKAEAACAVQRARANSIWSIHSADGLIGGMAFLPLNALGLYKLIYGKLDLCDPDLDCISAHPERPAILYLWALVAKGSGLAGLSSLLDFLETAPMRRVDIWTRPVSEAGKHLARRLGFEAVGPGERSLYKYDRSGP
jgi:hypothetical protein